MKTSGPKDITCSEKTFAGLSREMLVKKKGRTASSWNNAQSRYEGICLLLFLEGNGLRP